MTNEEPVTMSNKSKSNSPSSDGWHEWSRYVLNELKRLNRNYEKIQRDIGVLRTDLATLKVKSGVWGAAGAMVPIAIMLIIQLLK